MVERRVEINSMTDEQYRGYLMAIEDLKNMEMGDNVPVWSSTDEQYAVFCAEMEYLNRLDEKEAVIQQLQDEAYTEKILSRD